MRFFVVVVVIVAFPKTSDSEQGAALICYVHPLMIRGAVVREWLRVLGTVQQWRAQFVATRKLG